METLRKEREKGEGRREKGKGRQEKEKKENKPP